MHEQSTNASQVLISYREGLDARERKGARAAAKKPQPLSQSLLTNIFQLHDEVVFDTAIQIINDTVREKAEFIKLLQDLPVMITQLNFQPPLDVIQGHDVVVIHLVADGKLSSGGEYKNEYVFMIRFRREEICKVKEFMDSKYLSGIFGEQK
ncbi:hypothetical protein B0H10DRAFT_1939802 [Mycena sp. CBHHK59/15]|nr:hypothetical protein B0H10DRAFT_1939802 [Mycena sp. CBHHK59/15]